MMHFDKIYLYRIRKSYQVTFEEMYRALGGTISIYQIYLVEVGRCTDNDIAQIVLHAFNRLTHQCITLDEIYTNLSSDQHSIVQDVILDDGLARNRSIMSHFD